MKKIMAAFFTAAVLLTAPAAMADNDIRVYLDNERVSFDQPPVVRNDRTLVPIRAVFEKAGAEVNWDQSAETASVKYRDTLVTIRPNDSFLYANGKAVRLDVPSVMENNRILIPLRAISEAIDFKVTWNGATKSVLIATEGGEYRPYTSLYTGMKDIRDYADFYGDYSFKNLEADINGDGITDLLSFTKTLDASSEKEPLLVINNVDFSETVRNLRNLYAVSVVDIDRNDNEKELVLVSGGDCLKANILTYQNGNLKLFDKQIEFLDKLFFDGNQNFISDMDGFTFTDIMSTGAIYVYEKNTLKTYQANIQYAKRTMTRVYDDKAVFRITVTDDFKPGSYRNSNNRLITSSELERFDVLDIYIDKDNPSYTEYYVKLSDGTKAVLTSYRP